MGGVCVYGCMAVGCGMVGGRLGVGWWSAVGGRVCMLSGLRPLSVGLLPPPPSLPFLLIADQFHTDPFNADQFNADSLILRDNHTATCYGDHTFRVWWAHVSSMVSKLGMRFQSFRHGPLYARLNAALRPP